MVTYIFRALNLSNEIKMIRHDHPLTSRQVDKNLVMFSVDFEPKTGVVTDMHTGVKPITNPYDITWEELSA